MNKVSLEVRELAFEIKALKSVIENHIPMPEYKVKSTKEVNEILDNLSLRLLYIVSREITVEPGVIQYIKEGFKTILSMYRIE